MGEKRNFNAKGIEVLARTGKPLLLLKHMLLPLAFLLLVTACSPQGGTAEILKMPPMPFPQGVLIQEIPENMDIIFDSIRYVLNDPACLDTNFEVDSNFINLPGCNALIYNSQDNTLAAKRQLFTMDLDTGAVIQVTNLDCVFILGQAVDSISSLEYHSLKKIVAADKDAFYSLSGRKPESIERRKA